MKKLAITAAFGWALLNGPASAADLTAKAYTKAPSVVASIYDWSGFYVGLNGGGGWSHKCWDVFNAAGIPIVPAVAEGCHDASGATAGGQIGYRWQSAGWVFGVEGQGNWSNIRGSHVQLPGLAGNTDRSTVEGIGLFTGQVGYSWNNVLWYLKGGATVARDKYEGIVTPTGIVFDRARETRWGGVVGTGVEFGFARNWSVAFEYDHLFLGTRDNSFAATGAGFALPPGSLTRSDRISQDADLVTARINYRFGGPVVARY